MRELNKFLLNFIIKSEMKNKSNKEAVTGIFYQIAEHLNTKHNKLSHQMNDFYPHLSKTDMTVDSFLEQCYQDSLTKLKYKGNSPSV